MINESETRVVTSDEAVGACLSKRLRSILPADVSERSDVVDLPSCSIVAGDPGAETEVGTWAVNDSTPCGVSTDIAAGACLSKRLRSILPADVSERSDVVDLPSCSIVAGDPGAETEVGTWAVNDSTPCGVSTDIAAGACLSKRLRSILPADVSERSDVVDLPSCSIVAGDPGAETEVGTWAVNGSTPCGVSTDIAAGACLSKRLRSILPADVSERSDVVDLPSCSIVAGDPGAETEVGTWAVNGSTSCGVSTDIAAGACLSKRLRSILPADVSGRSDVVDLPSCSIVAGDPGAETEVGTWAVNGSTPCGVSTDIAAGACLSKRLRSILPADVSERSDVVDLPSCSIVAGDPGAETEVGTWAVNGSTSCGVSTDIAAGACLSKRLRSILPADVSERSDVVDLPSCSIVAGDPGAETEVGTWAVNGSTSCGVSTDIAAGACLSKRLRSILPADVSERSDVVDLPSCSIVAGDPGAETEVGTWAVNGSTPCGVSTDIAAGACLSKRLRSILPADVSGRSDVVDLPSCSIVAGDPGAETEVGTWAVNGSTPCGVSTDIAAAPDADDEAV
ncbi:hypothetical protein GCK72_012503 [Caenorhabditis remanei]|uniref:Uncharacterized protein n=1 Tax=Caenorhabditis remanei TaxID=31234 RepID=A0A6A5GL83_CAERE|nr:hypothetical protein GCK72_012503 [Caenorhabditis remanei]KAF1756050.1 hypothetical protein GCK72_012503 [Caenorhabditis remanei]